MDRDFLTLPPHGFSQGRRRMAGLAGSTQGSLSLTPAPAPWLWVLGLISGICAMRDWVTDKGGINPRCHGQSRRL